MSRSLFGVTLVLLALPALVAEALDHASLEGAESMNPVMWEAINSCPGAATGHITTQGGDSTAGANAMIAGYQTIAPMARPPSSAEICNLHEGATAEGLMLGLEAHAIVSGAPEAQACGSALAHSSARSFPVVDRNGEPVIDCPGCQPGTNRYLIDGWRDVLALVYAGIHHGQPQVTDCDSPVRRSLVASWGNLFERPCAEGSCPQGLRRALRMADFAAVTDNFTALVGLPSVPLPRGRFGAVPGKIPFCNAHGLEAAFAGDADYLDQDPIRIPCADDDQVCGHTVPGRVGTLGLVLPIVVPISQTQALNYPTRLCDVGKFRFAAPTAEFGPAQICPNGLPRLFNKCFLPVAENPDGSYETNCLARRFPVQGIGGNGMDGRTYNLFPKRGGMNRFYQQDDQGRYITGAFYRLHTTRARTAAATCRSQPSSAQVACLTAAQGCSLGQTDRRAEGVTPGTVALALNGLRPDRPNIEAIVSTPAPEDDYPLARPVYLNTLVGFEDPVVQVAEFALARCMGRSSHIASIMEARGYVPVPGGVRCVDWSSNACPASATDACANNPPDMITP